MAIYIEICKTQNSYSQRLQIIGASALVLLVLDFIMLTAVKLYSKLYTRGIEVQNVIAHTELASKINRTTFQIRVPKNAFLTGGVTLSPIVSGEIKIVLVIVIHTKSIGQFAPFVKGLHP